MVSQRRHDQHQLDGHQLGSQLRLEVVEALASHEKQGSNRRASDSSNAHTVSDRLPNGGDRIRYTKPRASQ